MMLSIIEKVMEHSKEKKMGKTDKNMKIKLKTLKKPKKKYDKVLS